MRVLILVSLGVLAVQLLVFLRVLRVLCGSAVDLIRVYLWLIGAYAKHNDAVSAHPRAHLRARGEALSESGDRLASAGQVAPPPYLRGLLQKDAHARRCLATHGIRAWRSGSHAHVEPPRAPLRVFRDPMCWIPCAFRQGMINYHTLEVRHEQYQSCHYYRQRNAGAR